ncbi:hypothetical protein AB0M54_20195 [Actinoplanes sp. NPDC051470]|uniref:hypothetical protein n=1 Tax=unclassified Actinoplanes TaxID=2626549 RepID=UPI003415FDAC
MGRPVEAATEPDFIVMRTSIAVNACFLGSRRKFRNGPTLHFVLWESRAAGRQVRSMFRKYRNDNQTL